MSAAAAGLYTLGDCVSANIRRKEDAYNGMVGGALAGAAAGALKCKLPRPWAQFSLWQTKDWLGWSGSRSVVPSRWESCEVWARGHSTSRQTRTLLRSKRRSGVRPRSNHSPSKPSRSCLPVSASPFPAPWRNQAIRRRLSTSRGHDITYITIPNATTTGPSDLPS